MREGKLVVNGAAEEQKIQENHSRCTLPPRGEARRSLSPSPAFHSKTPAERIN